MKINQKGAIDAMFIVAIVLVLVVGGVVYWRINSGDETQPINTPVANTSEEESEPVEDTGASLPEGWKQYSYTKHSISFGYPADWTITKEKNYAGNDGLIVKSPDYGEIELGIGGTTASKGGAIYLWFTPTKLKSAKDIKYVGLQKQLYDRIGVTQVSVGGIVGVQHEWDYEGDSALVTDVITNGTHYEIWFDGEVKFESSEHKSKLYPIYKQLLETVQFTN